MLIASDSAMSAEQVFRRHRGKSAPRGRSPDPKALKKAAKEKNGKGDPFVTPPPRTAKSKDKQSSSDSTRRGLTFGKNTIFDIRAENKAPEPNLRQADAILDGLKDFSSRCVDMATQSVEPSLHPATAPIP